MSIRQLSSTAYNSGEGVRIMAYLLPFPLASTSFHYVLLYFCLHLLMLASRVDDSMDEEEKVD